MIENENKTEYAGRSEPITLQHQKDIITCRAERCGPGGNIICLIDKKYFCKHRLAFDMRYYCLHPQRMEIVAQTDAEPDK